MADIQGNLERAALELREALKACASEPLMRMDTMRDLVEVINALEEIDRRGGASCAPLDDRLYRGRTAR